MSSRFLLTPGVMVFSSWVLTGVLRRYALHRRLAAARNGFFMIACAPHNTPNETSGEE